MTKFKNVLPVLAMLGAVLIGGCEKDNDPGKGPGATPTVTSSSPENNATGVARSTDVTFEFSEEMDPATINASTFTFMQGAVAVPGVVSYTGTTAVFTPTAPLSASMVYTATITTGAKDLS